MCPILFEPLLESSVIVTPLAAMQRTAYAALLYDDVLIVTALVVISK